MGDSVGFWAFDESFVLLASRVGFVIFGRGLIRYTHHLPDPDTGTAEHHQASIWLSQILFVLTL